MAEEIKKARRLARKRYG
ncbi:hypothetical protein [Serratia marcescens]